MSYGALGESLESKRQKITGLTRVYGVIGDPIDHSLSPAIQNSAFQSIGLNAIYVPFRVSGSGLGSAVHGLRALGISGFNVTTPHKTAILRYLDNVDTRAAEIGSINTVLNHAGTLTGFNTDGSGAMAAMRNAGLSLGGQTLLLLGAGGAARAIAYSIGQSSCSVTLMNRTTSSARRLAKLLAAKFGIKAEYAPLTRKAIHGWVDSADIILNASSMGMDAKNTPPIERKWLRRDQWVFDIVYRPLQTKLLRDAISEGARTINGLEMLLGQGAESFAIWTGKEPPTRAMRRALAEKLRN
jgi:shikimate dehydrogenase